jgi:hypothetical protein
LAGAPAAASPPIQGRSARQIVAKSARAAGRKAEMTLNSAGLTAGATALGFVPIARPRLPAIVLAYFTTDPDALAAGSHPVGVGAPMLDGALDGIGRHALLSGAGGQSGEFRVGGETQGDNLPYAEPRVQ